MKTITILISKDLDARIDAALQNEQLLSVLKQKGGRKNSGKGELIRRALKTGLAIEFAKLTKLAQE